MFAEKHPLVLAYEKAEREYRRVAAGPEPIETVPRGIWQNACVDAFLAATRAADACDKANLPIKMLDHDLR